MSAKRAKFEYYRDSDGVELKVETSAQPRYTEASARNHTYSFFMYPCWRKGVRCEISSATLSVLPKIRKRRSRGDAR